MKNMLAAFAAVSATAAGYLAGDAGGLDVPSAVVGVVAVLALLASFVIPGDARQPDGLRSMASRPKPGIVAPVTPVPGPVSGEEFASPGQAVTVRLRQVGRNQIAVIKVLRKHLDLGLKEAKDLSDLAKDGGAPVVAEAMDGPRAVAFARDIEDAGGILEIEEAPTR